MTIAEIQKEIIADFSFFDDWEERYNYIIDLGRTIPLIDPQYKTDQYLIRGCQSQVWLHSQYKDGKVFLTADSDAIITKGIVGILIRVFSGQTPSEILSADMHFIDQIGLKEHLSPTRANGLVSMIEQIHLYAKAYELTNKK